MRLRDVIINVIVDVIIFLKTSATVPYHMELALSKSVAREGERVKATCNVTTNDTKRNYQVVWFKILPDNIADDDDIEIATNMFVNDEFRRSKRYEAGFELTTPGDVSNVRFFLEISNVQSGDSGYIGCRIDMPPMMPVERFKLFTVQVPVESVWWSSSFPDDVTDPLPVTYETTANVSLSEGETRQLTCHCHGAYPRPDVDVHMGSEDLTHQFTRSDELVKVEGAVAGLHPIYYDVELSSRRMNIEYRFDGKSLKCRARLPGTQDNKAAVLHVRISQYKPKFFCVRQMLTRIGEVNFNLTCRVKAEPEVKNATIYRNDNQPIKPIQPIKPFILFSILSDSNNNFSVAAAHNDSEDLRSHTETISESEMLMVLWFGKVSPKHLGAYIFEAENELGVERHKLELHQELSAELHSMYVGVGSTASASPAYSSSLLLVTKMMMAPMKMKMMMKMKMHCSNVVQFVIVVVVVIVVAALTAAAAAAATDGDEDGDGDGDAVVAEEEEKESGHCVDDRGVARGLLLAGEEEDARRRGSRRRRTGWINYL